MVFTILGRGSPNSFSCPVGGAAVPKKGAGPLLLPGQQRELPHKEESLTVPTALGGDRQTFSLVRLAEDTISKGCGVPASAR